MYNMSVIRTTRVMYVQRQLYVYNLSYTSSYMHITLLMLQYLAIVLTSW